MDVTLDSIRDIQLYQSKIGYRFSVDALLLYNFVNLNKVHKIADLGAGSGIVGILLAKKYHGASVDLLEIQESLVTLAKKNVLLNGLEDRVKVIRRDLRTLSSLTSSPYKYDLVVSNPPFRKFSSGLISIGEEKAVARHEIKLNLNELIRAASFCLREKGRLCMIYHPNRISELIEKLKGKNLEPKRLRFVYSNTSAESKIILLEAVKGGRTGLKVEKPFYVYKEDGRYSDEMHAIYNSE